MGWKNTTITGFIHDAIAFISIVLIGVIISYYIPEIACLAYFILTILLAVIVFIKLGIFLKSGFNTPKISTDERMKKLPSERLVFLTYVPVINVIVSIYFILDRL